MSEKKITVFVYLPGETVAVPAGIFTHDEKFGIGSFRYGKKYMERKNALPVDPVALPLGHHAKEVSMKIPIRCKNYFAQCSKQTILITARVHDMPPLSPGWRHRLDQGQ
jgi:hypothetical protein